MSFNLNEFFKHSMVFPLYQLTAKADSDQNNIRET